MQNPARGRDGGRPGRAGAVALRSGRPIRPKGRQTVPPRDAICLQLPGGGGFGDPRARDPERVRDDVLDGLITAEERAAIMASRSMPMAKSMWRKPSVSEHQKNPHWHSHGGR